jgi:TolB-like protein/Tfp pilus assembly protein PilF
LRRQESNLSKLIEELKRRNVIRVGIAYLVATWVVLQIADLVLENIGAPDWVMQALMLVFALCFPLALLFSWAFELTPEGIKREKDVRRGESITRQTAHKLDRMTVGLLFVVILIVAVERLMPEADVPEPAPAAVTATEKSIAVLAFQDLSPEGDQEYFAEGISEELLNVLAQIPDLKVAGRTSSFAFKDQKRDLREIGEILEVAHILEGSVRTSGDRVRVTAQLVKAEDGFHLFSKNYDRKLTDIFEVQDDIAREIATALRSAILGDQPVEKSTPTPVEAYEKYLHARQWIHSRDRHLMEEASVLLDEALAIDPSYAPALAQKALAINLLSKADGAYGDIPLDVAIRESRPLIDKALELDPDLAEAYAVLGLWYSNGSPTSSEQAIASLRRSLAINPSNANASNWLANELAGAENFNESLRLYEAVVERDPLYAPAFNNVVFHYMQTRSMDRAESLVRRVERITGESPNILFARGALSLANGKFAEAVEQLGRAHAFNTSASVVSLWYGNALFYLGEFESAAEVFRITDKLLPLELAGLNEEAAELFESLDGLIYDESTLSGIGDWMLIRERPEELLAFLEALAGDGKDWLEDQPRPNQLWGATHMTNVAYALLATDRVEEAERVLADIREILGKQADYGANNMFYWWNKAEYAALTGDVEAMLSSMRRTIDTGLVCTAGFYTAPFNRYRNDARFKELEDEVIRRANAERRKLGMLEV